MNVAVTPDSEVLVSACDDGAVQVNEVGTGRYLSGVSGLDIPRAVSTSMDHRLLAIAESKLVSLWDMKLLKQVHALESEISQ